MPRAPRKTAVLTVRLSPDVKDALQACAKLERRSLTNMLEVAVLDYCNRRALIAPKKAAKQ
jgi:predicted transcriptional regulator